MSTEKSEAIVLRTVPWSETSFVVTLFTRDFGRISAIARGARRLRSPFETSLDLLARSQIVFIHKGHDTLDLLTESKLSRRFRSGQKALLPLYCGFYLAELLLCLTEEHQPLPKLYDLADATLVALDAGFSPGELVLRFEMQLLNHLGHLPTFRLCAGCGNLVESDRGEPGIRLGIVAGGVLCPNCLAGQHMVIRIHQSSLKVLIEYSQLELNQVPPPIDPSSRSEIRFVMEKFVSNLSDRKMRLTDFLEELKR
jgi:DNA repair protein RecO (recombination protein O)